MSPVCPRVWTAPSWQELFSRLQHWSVRPCVRPLDAVHKTAGHNALADQAPVKSPHSTMRWHLWVVLIAGSTGSGLRAVRPPNLHIKPDRAPPSFLSPSPEIVRKVDDWLLRIHADGSDLSVGSCERRSHIDTSD